MKKEKQSIEDIKIKLNELKGIPIKLEINRGRRKIDKFDAVITDLYPSVFTVIANEENINKNKTFSYLDVLCGDVRILDA